MRHFVTIRQVHILSVGKKRANTIRNQFLGDINRLKIRNKNIRLEQTHTFQGQFDGACTFFLINEFWQKISSAVSPISERESHLRVNDTCVGGSDSICKIILFLVKIVKTGIACQQ